MSGFVAVALRELGERRLLPLAGLLLGLAPFAVAWLPAVARQHPPSEVRAATALVLFALVGTAMAIVLGASIFGRDLAEGRLGFYFSRPISGLALWAGKLAAAVGLVAAACVLVLLPTALAGDLALGGDLPLTDWALPGGGSLSVSWAEATVPGFALRWLGLVLFALGLAHALRLAALARSLWSLLDLAALAAFFAAVRWLTAGLARELAFGPASVVFGWCYWAIVAGLLAGSALQLARARTELGRGQRLLSGAVWGLALVAVIAGAAWSRWVLAVAPTDLTLVTAARPVDGGWIAVRGLAGRRAGWEPAFLWQPDEDRWVRTRLLGSILGWPWEAAGPRIDAAGRRAVWLEYDGVPLDSALSLVVLDLAEPAAPPRRLTLPGASWADGFALAADGATAAVLGEGRLTPVDLETGLPRAPLAIPRIAAEARVFFDPHAGHVVRIAVRTATADPAGPATFRWWTADLAKGEVDAASVPGVATWRAGGDGRVVLLGDGAGGLRRLDLATGETRPVPLPGPGLWSGEPLGDDGLLLQGGSGSTLAWVAPDGEPRARIEFPPGTLLHPGGRPAPRRLVVRAGRRTPPEPGARRELAGIDWAVWIVDLATGERHELAPALRPIATPEHGPDDLGSRLFLTGSGGLVRWDPAGGALEPLLPLLPTAGR